MSSNDLGLLDDKEEPDLEVPDFDVPVLGLGSDMGFWADRWVLRQHQSSTIRNDIGEIRFILNSFFYNNGLSLTKFLHKWLQTKVQKYAIIGKLCALCVFFYQTNTIKYAYNVNRLNLLLLKRKILAKFGLA